MNILITGGAGFIGSHLAKKLIQLGHKIIIVDNFNDYYDVSLKEARINDFLADLDFKVYRKNICDLEGLRHIFQANQIDAIAHLAAQAGVRYSIENPFLYHNTNIGGTLNLFELARAFEIKNIIYASSSSVYGANESLPFKENQIVNTPLSIYAASKIATELIAHVYHSLYGISSMGLRYFTVYGPWGRPDMALGLFTAKILRNQPINIHNHGLMKRNFSYIDDIVNGTAKAVLDQLNGYHLINLGSDQSVELNYFIELIEKYLNKKASRNYLPIQKGEVQDTKADLALARELLNFQPRITVEEGVKRYTDWYQDYYS